MIGGNKMSENYIVINGKRVELTKEQMDQLGINVEEDKRWRAKINERYWCVNSYNVTDVSWDKYCTCDNFRYYSHNYFQTQKEAETYARVLETEMLLKKYADEHNYEFKKYKYYLMWSSTISKYRIDFISPCVYSPRTIFFSSEKIIKDAIKEIGRDRIIEYLTYEW
jgi:hypothetical protein